VRKSWAASENLRASGRGKKLRARKFKGKSESRGGDSTIGGKVDPGKNQGAGP